MSRSSTPEKLRKAAEDVNYEIRMLIFSAEHVDGWHASPMAPPGGDEKCMALESFLLHFRNLRAFLCPSLQKFVSTNDVLASDFLGKPKATDEGDPEKLEGNHQRLDRMLAHISYSRSDYIEQGDYGWDTSEMLIDIASELQKFVLRLSDEQRSWLTAVKQLEEARVRAHYEITNRRGTVSNSTVTSKGPFRLSCG